MEIIKCTPRERFGYMYFTNNLEKRKEENMYLSTRMRFELTRAEPIGLDSPTP